MKDSKKLKGTKHKLTKGKRVSLRCPLTIDRTDLEYNYDAGTAQICLTLENAGGGGVTNDSVESAIVVIRLFDAKGALIPCSKNEYFAKMLRFGDEGLQSGANITFRLTPDCDGGLRVENLELYISRVRYADGSVTDYLRGDFFDMPGDAIPLQKKHKKEIDAITAKFGSSARFEPEELTDIIWRCTCGEFCESDQCATCGSSKSELFDYFHLTAPKAAVVAPKTAPDADTTASAPAGKDSSFTDKENAPATDATTEYDTEAFLSSAAGTANEGFSSPDSDTGNEDSDSDAHEFRPVPAEKKVDKLKISLIIAIAASGVVLAVIIVLLIITMVARNKQPADNTTIVTTTEEPAVSEPPVNNDDPALDNEKIVRAYMEQNNYDNALGYARMSECSDQLINEILTKALEYYTETAPDAEQAMKYAQELNNTAVIDALNLQRYEEAILKSDFESALAYAEKLLENKDAKISAAAEGLVQKQLAANDFEAALKTVNTYQTTTTAEDISKAAITYHTNKQEFDKALELAEELEDEERIVSIARAAIDYYVGQQNYDSAADYVKLTGNSADVENLLPHFTEPAIRKHLPTFFPYLTFEQKQEVHASVMSTSTTTGIIDVYGNAFWGEDQSHIASETGKTVVSIKNSKSSTVLLFSDGTVAAFGDNAYGQCNVSDWRNIVAIDAGDYHTVGLKSDGSVVAVGRDSEQQCNVDLYKDAVAVAAGGYHTMILLSDGSVEAVGMASSGQCNTSDWEDVVAISAGFLHSVGLKSDGTVVAAGSSTTGRCDVDEWKNIIQISAGENCTVGLTAEGRLLFASNEADSINVSGLANVIWVSAGSTSVTALHTNGVPISAGTPPTNFTYVSGYEVASNIYGVK